MLDISKFIKSFQDFLQKEVFPKLNEHEKLFEQNEAQVTLSIVLHLLSFLNWNVFNPDDIRIQVTDNLSSEHADLVLYINNQPLIVIEVKNQKTSLENSRNVMQLIRYITNLGAPYGILTNGLHWKLYKGFQEGTSPIEREIIEVNLLNLKKDLANTKKEINIKNKVAFMFFYSLSKEGLKSILDKIKVLEELRPILKLLKQDHLNKELLEFLLSDLLKGQNSKNIMNTAEIYQLHKDRIKSKKYSKISLCFKYKDNNKCFEAKNFPSLIRDVIIWATKENLLTHNLIPLKTSAGKNWLSRDKTNLASRAKVENIPYLGKVYISYGANRQMAMDRLKRLLTIIGIKPESIKISIN